MYLPRHLRFLEEMSGATGADLGVYYPETAAGTLVPKGREAGFDAGGLVFVGPKDGSMVPLAAEQAEPMAENIWSPGKLSALVRAIESGDNPHVDPGYADLWMEDGELSGQVRDGNHRAFAPIAAGGSMTWVLMSDATRQDLDLRAPGSEALYRAIRAAQREYGAPLFVRRQTSKIKPGRQSKLLEAEREFAELTSREHEHYVNMLKTHGPSDSGFSLTQQLERPQTFWRLRVQELADQHGWDWAEENILSDDIQSLHKRRSELGSRLYDLRKEAGLKHGERLDPESGRVVNPVEAKSNAKDILRAEADMVSQALRDKYSADVWLGIKAAGDEYELPVISVESIHVPAARRGRGVGTAIMSDLVRWSDERGIILSLNPSSDFGGSVSRLRRFYSRFGFKPNKGRAKDFRTSDAMIRRPDSKRDNPDPAEMRAIRRRVLR